MTALEKITKAKIQLIINQPFFATLALGLKYVEDKSVVAASTNGEVIKYNPEFIDTLDVHGTMGLIAHEVMHLAMMHHLRRNGRDFQVWNEATDYAINGILKKSGFDLPTLSDGVPLYNQAYDGKSAEEIFTILKSLSNDNGKGDGNKDGDGSQDKNQSNGDDKSNGDDDGHGNGDKKSSGAGEIKDSSAQSQDEVSKKESDMKVALAQAAMVAKQQGKLPGNLQNLIDELLEPKIDWKSILNVFMTDISKSDYTWKKPSSRYMHLGLYLPSLEQASGGNFALIIDTSISTFDRGVLSQFVSEAKEIIGSIDGKFTVIHVDTEVQHVEEVQSDESIDMHLRGGGGTSFIPGFNYIQDNEVEVAAVVYLTDGYCTLFSEDPGIPTLWCVLDNKHFRPPFGEVLHITK